MAANPVAVVLCVHHKPWLVMSTILTTLLQDYADADIHLVYQVGNGACLDRASYAEYHDLARRHGVDPQLSPWDPRVREVCRLRDRAVFEHEFENDSALDSGAWYKFVRTGAWRKYEHVLFLGEGTLLARRTTLSAMLDFSRRYGVHSITSGHEKRRLPRSMVLAYNSRSKPTAMTEFHDRMSRRVFELFCTDPAFAELYSRWTDAGVPHTENHVPDIFSGDPFDRLRVAASPKRNSASDRGLAGAARASVRALVQRADRVRARRAAALGSTPFAEPAQPIVHVDGRRRLLQDVAQTTVQRGVRFHAVDEPEWYGCAVDHLFSRDLLERFAGKLDRYGLYEVLDLPFAGTALEIVWGFVPQWLGYRKWFTDGIHRVRKQFQTARREDDNATVASYINRYHRGAVCVSPEGDYLKIESVSSAHAGLRRSLPQEYWLQ